MTLKPFHRNGLFPCPLKTSGNLRFSDVFQGVQEKVGAMKWVKDISHKYNHRMLIFMLVL